MKTASLLLITFLAQTAFAKVLSTTPIVQQVVEVQLSSENCKIVKNYGFEKSNQPAIQCRLDSASLDIDSQLGGQIVGSLPVEASLYDVQVVSQERSGTVLNIRKSSDGPASELKSNLAKGEITAHLIYWGPALR